MNDLSKKYYLWGFSFWIKNPPTLDALFTILQKKKENCLFVKICGAKFAVISHSRKLSMRNFWNSSFGNFREFCNFPNKVCTIIATSIQIKPKVSGIIYLRLKLH